jgi:hypothetical protein
LPPSPSTPRRSARATNVERLPVRSPAVRRPGAAKAVGADADWQEF